MKIVEINTVRVGSTGKIMLQIAETARMQGHEVYTFSRAWRSERASDSGHEYVGYFTDNVIHRIIGPLTGCEGQFSYIGTRKLISKLRKIDPDIIHLHNLHGWYVNIPLLFRYIKEKQKKVIWTLHDCWAFTGRCPYFTLAKCDKWVTGCYDCAQTKEYPKTYVDNSKRMYRLKKEWFSGIDDMTVVTPSEWLAGLVKQSFLKDYPVKVIHNGIDLSIFKPTESDFRKKYNCEDKYILLGVAFGWGYRKGLDIFLELAKRLDENYQIVLVGTDENVDKQLPENIISIHRTNNQKELAEIYTAADLFVNPTREENYPTVNMESIACGTPVLTFKTGGSPEIVDENSGDVVECDDVDSLENEIIRICENKPYSKDACVITARRFDMKKRFEEYIELYEE